MANLFGAQDCAGSRSADTTLTRHLRWDANVERMASDSFANVHILIVDGKAGNARLLRGILLALGADDPVMADDTSLALDLLSTGAYQVIFCDDGVGPLNAAEFVTAVRRNRAILSPRVPIVVVSDGPQKSQVELMRKAGINDLIMRPLSLNAVKRKLLAVLTAGKRFAST
jgi:two-component system sensor histidine kinase EvgS